MRRADRLAQTARAIEQRRVEVARLDLMRLSSREIGARLGVDHKTITADISANREEWRAARDAATDAKREQQERELDALHLALWDRAMDSDDAAIDRALRVMERRAKLLGLDMPTRNALTTVDGRDVMPTVDEMKAMSDDELAALAAPALTLLLAGAAPLDDGGA